MLPETLEALRQSRDLLDRFDVRRIGVFGSVARGEPRHDSDLDLIVEFREKPGYFRFCALQIALAERLGRPVDLATPDMLRPEMRARVLADARYA